MGRDEKETDRRVRSAAYFVGLRDDQLEKSPFELSGGQKRGGTPPAAGPERRLCRR